jgi:hypothetical protein
MQSKSSRRQPNPELGIAWRNSSGIWKALENLILQQNYFKAKHGVFQFTLINRCSKIDVGSLIRKVNGGLNLQYSG